MKIAFVHPDLGIGGAERLIVDAAMELQARGHQVTIYTTHHDPSHCFPETRSNFIESCVFSNPPSHLDELKVRVYGDWLPTSIFGYFYLLCSAVRSIYLASVLACLHPRHFDLVIADQIAFHLPLLKCSARRILFYCHFPDKLLAPKSKRGFLRRGLYRRLLDWAEEACIGGFTDQVVVNSRFTQEIFAEAFPSIKSVPSVLYPGVSDANAAASTAPPSFLKEFLGKQPVYLSLNRFERKKEINLAIEATSLLPAGKLIVAGGFDPRNRENSDHLKELERICTEKSLKFVTHFASSSAAVVPSDTRVVFLPSISEALKRQLLSAARALIYTPSFEHFGIVPVEAMAAGLPVIAMNSGGPRETVSNHRTGILCDPTAESIAAAMTEISKAEKSKWSAACQRRVSEMFSLTVFGDELDRIVRKLCK